MATTHSDITQQGQRLIAEWLQATEEVTRLERMLAKAKTDESVCENMLAQWLAPKDIKPNEKIGVWMEDSLFQVESTEQVAYAVDETSAPRVVSYKLKVTVRTRGKHFSDFFVRG